MRQKEEEERGEGEVVGAEEGGGEGKEGAGGEGQPMRGTGGEVADIGWKGQVMGSFFNTGMP